MGFLSRLYRAETLDTRFAPKSGQRLPDAQPSKWNTPEYYLYYLCFLTIPFLMVKSVYDVSGPWHVSYKQYEHLLEPGWIPGRKVDNSDAQYRGFRENIPYMGMVVVLHPILRRVYERFTVSFSCQIHRPYSNGKNRNQQHPQHPQGSPLPKSIARPLSRHARNLGSGLMSVSQSSSCWLFTAFPLPKSSPSCTSTTRLQQHCRVNTFLPRLGSSTSPSFSPTSCATAIDSRVLHPWSYLLRLLKLVDSQETGATGSTATAASSRDGRSSSTFACCGSSASTSTTTGA